MLKQISTAFAALIVTSSLVSYAESDDHGKTLEDQLTEQLYAKTVAVIASVENEQNSYHYDWRKTDETGYRSDARRTTRSIYRTDRWRFEESRRAPVRAPESVVEKEHSIDTFPLTFFEFDSDELNQDAAVVLNSIGRVITAPDLKDYRFRVIGHTDASGSHAYNSELSKRRALRVARYLTENFAVEPGRLTIRGAGEAELLNPDKPYASENRRVEFSFVS